jgi:aminopeptidase N
VSRFVYQVCSLLVLLAPCTAASAEIVHHDLSLRIDSEVGSIRASDRVRLRPPRAASFTLAKNLTLDRLAVNGSVITVEANAGRWEVAAANGAEQTIEVEYSGRPEPGARGLVVSTAETVLSGGAWYPIFDEALLSYRLTVETRPELTAVAPGKLVEEGRSPEAYRAVFESEAPADDIAVFAAAFDRKESRQGHVVRTYLHPEVADLADLYLKKSADYLALYESSIGPYPFSAFSVVSTRLPVGLGFPGLTLIGTRVLRLPFIPDTSLGHEVLHSWWGNGVLIDPAEGNWAEGLTTFMADYAYAERDGDEKAHEMRLRWLRDYASLPAEEDRPLTSFHGRSHAASQVVGYHKAAALFVMLRDLIGRDAFAAGIRRFWSEHRFQAATWGDLQTAFEKASSRSLGGFFQQWLERSGAPQLALRGAEVRQAGAAYELALSLSQAPPPYDLEVPVEIDFESETMIRSVHLAAEREDYVLPLKTRPTALRIDPEHRLFRRLDPAAVPAILRGVAYDRGAATVIVASDDESREAAGAVADAFFEQPARVSGPELPSTPCLIVGTDELVRELLARNGLTVPASIDGKGTARAWATKRDNGAPIAAVSGGDGNALRAVARPLPHYGGQSFIVFDGSNATERGVWPAEETSLQVRFD